MITEINMKLKEYVPLKNINGKLVPLNISEWIESEEKLHLLWLHMNGLKETLNPIRYHKMGKNYLIVQVGKSIQNIGRNNLIYIRN